ncbi:hypothetical protein AB0N73_13225 [Microbacterium sp. NPDC089189]|uniref:hypothetical protein n=1 Tax=Microbacterium sp. NPDC089189 TaxID=3154972 RepID=UPI003436DE6F
MSENTPHTRDSDDAHADGAPPTESITDEVKASAAVAAGQLRPDGGAAPEQPDDSAAEAAAATDDVAASDDGSEDIDDLQDDAIAEGTS